MADFKFVKIPSPSINSKIGNLEMWTILAPKRSYRPKQKRGEVVFCPFCPGSEKDEPEIYRIGGQGSDSNWLTRVIRNKFPFAPIHEIVIHSPEHEARMSGFALDQVRLVIETYVNRYNAHFKDGSVCIFCNSGKTSGESIVHQHSQIAVVSTDVQIIVPRIERDVEYRDEFFAVKDFEIFCPPFSQWPDEVWIVPKERGRLFGEIRYEEIESFAYILKRLIKILEIRHGNDFPYNYYIYPFHDWYLRIIPRSKTPGGFELATGIYVNTQEPSETMKFIKEHFYEEEETKIKKSSAQYRRGV
ncbi:MAG: hypothetical protein C4584_02830 [Armatimonadetes bacterium]|nr:MAG: hypothetical protein C4584_02830 [Armatimonadota bacterium]